MTCSDMGGYTLFSYILLITHKLTFLLKVKEQDSEILTVLENWPIFLNPSIGNSMWGHLSYSDSSFKLVSKLGTQPGPWLLCQEFPSRRTSSLPVQHISISVFFEMGMPRGSALLDGNWPVTSKFDFRKWTSVYGSSKFSLYSIVRLPLVNLISHTFPNNVNGIFVFFPLRERCLPLNSKKSVCCKTTGVIVFDDFLQISKKSSNV